VSTVQSQNAIHFGPFCLDRANQCLWRGKQAVALKPKAFAVLRYLVEHPGCLLTKNELLDAVWLDAVVSEGVLKFCVREIRKALGDNAHAPRFIETLHRRGYRFIAPVAASAVPVSSSQFQVPSSLSPLAPSIQSRTPVLVGREEEQTQLHSWLEKALHGERQIVFVTGEPGIGKTAVVEAFLHSLETEDQKPSLPKVQTLDTRLWLGHGQCVEHYGASEAYLPILSALGQLCREPSGQHFIELLNQHAPTWLVQMPTLLTTTQLEVLQRKTQGATQERMLREFAEAIEVLTVEKPLVLVLEDVHWSDVSTLDLLSVLARRRQPARLLVISTYRPVEALARKHPLHVVKQELQLHGQCEELLLGLLSETAVEKYLAVRFSVEAFPAVPLQELARLVHQRTEGNPLFIVNLVDYLLAQGALVQRDGQWVLLEKVEATEAGVPQNLRKMIEKQFDRLSLEEQRLLEAASVAGVEFSPVAVAAALGSEVEQIEEWCEGLARRHFFLHLTGSGVWPDGTLAVHYMFLHALYQNVLYERVPMTRRQRLHQHIGERQEEGYGEQTREIAAELAAHFERSRDYQRAVRYLGQAGQNASARSAHREASNHLTTALELLKTLPDTSERTRKELTLQIALGLALMATRGIAAPEVEQAYARARELCRQIGETPQLFPVLVGLFRFYLVRAELQTAHELGKQCLSLAQKVQDSALLLEAHMALGPPLLFLGEMASAREQTERGIALYDPHQHCSHAFLYALDPGAICLSIAALSLWCLGYPNQALQRSHEALALAQELTHPLSQAFTLFVAAMLRQFRREGQAAKEQGEAVMALSDEQGFSQWLAQGTIVWGAALAEQGQEEEGMVRIRQGLAAHQAMGAGLWRPCYLAFLVEVYRRLGLVEEGLAALAEALALTDKTGERWHEAELYRLRGELTLAQSSVPSLEPRVKEVEEDFLRAIGVARKQEAKLLELRAVMSLARLWQQQGQRAEAHKLLSDVYHWFTEGFDTKDLQEATALLEELA
jgi:predicted ATPase/DNA-binding winged helix-turn-helix (wHTH) protein